MCLKNNEILIDIDVTAIERCDSKNNEILIDLGVDAIERCD